MVSVYAETEGQKIKGVPSAMVVSPESANPNLRIGSAPPLRVIPVPDKDHSELVKPSSVSDWVVEGLDDLIRRVLENDFSFNAADTVQRQVGLLIHAELFKSPRLLELSCFRAIAGTANGASDDRVAMFKVAKTLAASEGDAVLAQLSNIAKSFDEIAKGDGLANTRHKGLMRIGCALLMAYMQTDAYVEAKQEFGPEIGIAEFEDPEQLDIMIEVLHASLRSWPVNLKLSDNNSCLESGSWTLSPAGISPGAWNEDDHLHHLSERIWSSRPTPDDGLRGKDHGPWPAEDDASIGPAGQRLKQAKSLLENRLRRQIGLLLDTRTPGSPYAEHPMRKKLGETFGELIAVVLPAADRDPDPLTQDKLIRIQAEGQQFLLKAQGARP